MEWEQREENEKVAAAGGWGEVKRQAVEIVTSFCCGRQRSPSAQEICCRKNNKISIFFLYKFYP